MSDTPSFAASLKRTEVRAFIAGFGFFTLASRALAVVIGFQIYRITHSAMALGWLGMVEAVPAISLVLFGGWVADHFDRRRILVITRAASCVCGAALVFLSWRGHAADSLWALYGVIFLAGVARGFADPANTALEAHVAPRELTVNLSSWMSSTWVACAVAGPAAIGFVFDAWGVVRSYAIITASFVLGWFFTLFISPTGKPAPSQKEPFFKSIRIGWNYVFKSQPLWGALALDLFAVLFGGAMALLPIYADDILHVGAKGLGLLNAAPSVGALLVTLAATKRPPMGRAGRNLLLTVAGFGVSIFVFAFSKNFWLSMGALFLSGAFDGVSMVIRRSMVRLLSPDELRGRIAAANWIFICASNELGAFESGFLASFIGTVPCVAVGGVLTLVIVAGAGIFLKDLRRLRFDASTLEHTT